MFFLLCAAHFRSGPNFPHYLHLGTNKKHDGDNRDGQELRAAQAQYTLDANVVTQGKSQLPTP